MEEKEIDTADDLDLDKNITPEDDDKKDITPEDDDKKDSEKTAEKPDEEANQAAEIEKIEKKAADYLDKYQRTLAEFDNFRKRTLKEKASMYDDGIRDCVLKLIPVVDNFERAVSSVSDDEKSTGLYKGIEMVLKQFTEILESLGVSEIEAEGQTFDPNLHNAVMHIEDDKFDENVVAAVLQKGYICKDKVIRPSMVQVAN